MILFQVRELGCFFCGYVSIFVSRDVKVSRYPMQVYSSVEGFRDVYNLLCVWVEAVYTEEQRLTVVVMWRVRDYVLRRVASAYATGTPRDLC